MPEKKITQLQIAELAGVSGQVVSMVLNSDNPRCRPEVAERVLEIARKHNYRPSRVAKQMKNQKTGAIGIVIRHIYAINLEVFQAMLRAAIKYDYIIATEQMQCNDLSTTTFMKEKVVDGIIVFADIGPESEELTKNIHEPVLYYNAFKTKGKDVIIHNESQGAELAVKRLKKAGRKKIVFISLFAQDPHYSFEKRKTGIINSCKKHDIKYVKTLYCKDFYDEIWFDLDCLEVATRLAQELKDVDFDGAILYSDQLAGHFYEAMKILNKEIPKDCSVIAFNYSDITRVLRPRLASVYIPNEIIGQKIIERMVDLINGKNIKKEVVLDYELKDWESV